MESQLLRRNSRLAILAVHRRVLTALGLPRCNCPRHGGRVISGISPPCTCGPSGVGVEADRACPHVTLRRTRILRHPTLAGVFGLLVDAQVFARLTALEQGQVEARAAEWDGAEDEDDS